MKENVYDRIVDLIKASGIKFSGERYLFITDRVLIKRFLSGFVELDYPLGFDLFDGRCSGSSNISLKTVNLISLVAKDCGSDEYSFAVKSIFIVLGDRSDKSCPSIVFESDTLEPTTFTSIENVRKNLTGDQYDYLEFVKPKHYGDFVPTCNKDEVDDLISRRYYDDEDIVPFETEILFLNRKIFACLNVQLGKDFIHPFNFNRFLLKFKDASTENVNEWFSHYFSNTLE